MLLELASLLLVSIAVLVQGGGPEGLDFAASFAPDKILVGGLSWLRGHRVRVRVRVVHRLRGHRDLRRGVEGPEAHRSPRDVPRGHVITVLFAVTTFADGLGTRARQRRRGDRQALLGRTASRSRTRRRCSSRWPSQYVGDWLADLMSWLVISAACSPGCSPSRTRRRATSSRWGGPASAQARWTASTRRGAPCSAPIVTSVITGVVIVHVRGHRAGPGPQPVLLVQRPGGASRSCSSRFLVCFAVIAFFRRAPARAEHRGRRPSRRSWPPSGCVRRRVPADVALRPPRRHRGRRRRPDRAVVGPQLPRLHAGLPAVRGVRARHHRGDAASPARTPPQSPTSSVRSARLPGPSDADDPQRELDAHLGPATCPSWCVGLRWPRTAASTR